MADVLVSRERLFNGDLPLICAKTGTPASGHVSATFERVPPWTFLLLFAGIFPFFIAVLFVREQVKARVPMDREVVECYHRHRRSLWLGWGLLALAVLATALLREPWIMLGAGAGVLVIVVTEFRRARDWIGAVEVRNTPFVELRRVHPDFAAAVSAQQAPATPS